MVLRLIQGTPCFAFQGFLATTGANSTASHTGFETLYEPVERTLYCWQEQHHSGFLFVVTVRPLMYRTVKDEAVFYVWGDELYYYVSPFDFWTFYSAAFLDKPLVFLRLKHVPEIWCCLCST